MTALISFPGFAAGRRQRPSMTTAHVIGLDRASHCRRADAEPCRTDDSWRGARTAAAATVFFFYSKMARWAHGLFRSIFGRAGCRCRRDGGSDENDGPARSPASSPKPGVTAAHVLVISRRRFL